MSVKSEMETALVVVGAALFAVLAPTLMEEGYLERYWTRDDILVDAASLPSMPAPPAPEAPVQVPMLAQSIDLGRDKTALLSHRYVIEGTVVTRGRYRFSPHSDISPLDLGIVTGAMAEPEKLRYLQSWVGYRQVRYRWKDDAPAELVSAPGFGDWITNNHIIPATEDLRARLLAVRPGQSVRIEGYLVDVVAGGFGDWETSTERQDTGNGACEIILVTGLTVVDPRPGEDA